MINADMRLYEYYTYGALDAYGQETISDTPQGSIRMAIYISSQSVQDNINYLGSSYVGMTYDKGVNDSYVIKYGDEKLKVQYVNSQGRFIQVFLQKI